jgi:hypothetical protein
MSASSCYPHVCVFLLPTCLHLPAAHISASSCCPHVRLPTAHRSASSCYPHVRVFLLHTCLHLPVAHPVGYTSSFCPPGCVNLLPTCLRLPAAHLSASTCRTPPRIYLLPICFACSCRPSVCTSVYNILLSTCLHLSFCPAVMQRASRPAVIQRASCLPVMQRADCPPVMQLTGFPACLHVYLSAHATFLLICLPKSVCSPSTYSQPKWANWQAKYR